MATPPLAAGGVPYLGASPMNAAVEAAVQRVEATWSARQMRRSTHARSPPARPRSKSPKPARARGAPVVRRADEPRYLPAPHPEPWKPVARGA